MEASFWTGPCALTLWNLCLFGGIIFFVSGIVYFFIAKKSRFRIEYSAISELVSFWILNIPFEFCTEYDGSNGFLYAIHSVVISFLKTLTKYIGGDGYEPVFYVGQPAFSVFYGLIRAVVNIFMLLFMARLVIKYIDGPVQRFKLYTNTKRKVYFFSEFNEKTYSIAKSLPEQESKYVVFVGSKGELSDEDRMKIDEIDGVLIYDSLENAISRYIVNNAHSKNKAKTRGNFDIFLFEHNEKDNFSALDSIVDKLSKSIVSSRIFVELHDTPWDVCNDYLVNRDMINNPSLKEKDAKEIQRNVVINFVRVEENFAYNNFLQHSIFSNYIDLGIEDSYANKEIKILIAGVNERNLEVLKTVLHLSQMPHYYPSVLVIDEQDRPGFIPSIISDLKRECFVVGDAVYKYKYIGGVSSDSTEFLNRIVKARFDDFTFAFVNYDDDKKNISSSFKISQMCNRNSRVFNSGKNGYKIQTSITDKTVSEYWKKKLVEDIIFVGALEDVYSFDFITMSKIETVSHEIHEIRQVEKHEDDITYKIESWDDYLNDEYKRHSVFARTLSYRFKVKIMKEMGEDPCKVYKQEYPWKIYEHMRWNMYMRTLGYSYPYGELKDTLIAKTMEYESLNDELAPQRKKIRETKKQFTAAVKKKASMFGVTDYDQENILELQDLRAYKNIAKKYSKEELEKIDLEIKKLECEFRNIEAEIDSSEKKCKELNTERRNIRDKAKMHDDLTIYYDLHKNVKKYDSLRLTEKIVDVFEAIELLD